MKKSYIQPDILILETHTGGKLLSASGSQPTSIIDDETANGNESLAKQGSLWFDEEDESATELISY